MLEEPQSAPEADTIRVESEDFRYLAQLNEISGQASKKRVRTTGSGRRNL